YFAQMADFKIPEKVPESWRSLSKELIGKSPSPYFLDKDVPEARLKEEDQEIIKEKTEDIINKIKEVVFPLLGL
ncbi:MAG: hypothetical protein ACTSR3_18595, partial [Candidatus Helarchaeota archaeon]